MPPPESLRCAVLSLPASGNNDIHWGLNVLVSEGLEKFALIANSSTKLFSALCPNCGFEVASLESEIRNILWSHCHSHAIDGMQIAVCHSEAHLSPSIPFFVMNTSLADCVDSFPSASTSFFVTADCSLRGLTKDSEISI